MNEKKTEAALLKEKLFYTPKHAARIVGEEGLARADAFCEDYKTFLNEAKTEREAAAHLIALAREQGFRAYDENAACAPGDRIYYDNRGKSVILAICGTKPLSEGVRIAAAHIDSPRLDLKPNPLYEDAELALCKTHYYGGIKKYQWTAIPLALHGVVLRADGETVSVCIGEDDGDPKFVITDLLPHLAGEQEKRTLDKGIKGEELNLLVGSRPFRDSDEAEAVKLHILHLLYEKYGITEADFLSAELEAVPAFKACDIGLDRSMIGAYGHDDRVCAYPAAKAIFDTKTPEHTVLAVLTDKEEIGSEGNTGLKSAYMTDFIADLAAREGTPLRTVLCRSACLSADVNAAFDPTFPDVLEKRNAACLNRGVVITKYTGARGKAGTSDASAEFMGRVRRLLDANGVVWQTGELGKVDVGGGGTVAKFVAAHNMDVVDVGVPVLSMHAPLEVVAKLDVFMAYRAFHAFFQD